MKLRFGVIGGLLLASVIAAGCDWFEDPSPEFVRVIIDGDAGTMLRIRATTELLAAENEQGQLSVQLFDVVDDTVTLPFDRMWNIDVENRFLIQADVVEAQDSLSVRLRVWVDDRSVHSSQPQVTGETPALFLYLFNQQILNDVNVIF